MVGINNLYMAKMPNSCKECPLTYLDTGDDAYFGANERRCVIDDSCIDGMVSERAYDCPLIEAIPKAEVKKFLEEGTKNVSNNVLAIVREDYIHKADYEARLKADLEAILVELQLEIEELRLDRPLMSRGHECYGFEDKTPTEIRQECSDIIQEKIDKLKGKNKK